MADYTVWDINGLLPGEPWTSAKAIAAFENLNAAFEGAPDAPRLEQPAMSDWYYTAGGIGTYAFLRQVFNDGLGIGDTQPGSNLFPASILVDQFGDASVSFSASPVSGTWRLMGFIPVIAGADRVASLWMRIA